MPDYMLQLAGVLYSPRNDPDPEMIPNPEMIPKSTPKWSPLFFLSTRNDPQGIRERWLNMGLWIVFLFFVEMLQSCHFFLFLWSFRQKETTLYLLGHCLIPVSLQFRFSQPLTYLV